MIFFFFFSGSSSSALLFGIVNVCRLLSVVSCVPRHFAGGDGDVAGGAESAIP